MVGTGLLVAKIKAAAIKVLSNAVNVVPLRHVVPNAARCVGKGERIFRGKPEPRVREFRETLRLSTIEKCLQIIHRAGRWLCRRTNSSKCQGDPCNGSRATTCDAMLSTSSSTHLFYDDGAGRSPRDEGLVGGAAEPVSPHGLSNNESSSRFRVIFSLSMLVGLFLCQNALPKPLVDPAAVSDINHASEELVTVASSSYVDSADETPATDNASFVSGNTDTEVGDTDPKKEVPSTDTSSLDLNNVTDEASANSAPESGVKRAPSLSCQVPGKDLDKAPKLTSSTATTVFANCSSTMGQHIRTGRKELVANLPMNPRAHIFSLPLCVPQKNGNKKFGGFVYAAWNQKAAIDGYGVDRDMSHWEHHQLLNSKANRESHVYFAARNPYTRMLSMYLQKVVNACINDGQKGCDMHGWHGIKPKTSFKDFVEIIEEKLQSRARSLCGISHHLCQQVESCLTTTLPVKDFIVIRLKEQSCWFPCFVKQIGIKSALLNKGWEKFSGRSCYYSATGDCHDMLRSIDPTSVGHATGNVHATGASNRLAEHYDAKTAAIVSRLYADDFRILGYPLWDGVSEYYHQVL